MPATIFPVLPNTDWSLAQWLDYIERVHPANIEMGLARVQQVWSALQASFGLDLSQSQIVTVGGTNGKGSTCAILEAMLLAQGKRVGVYSSPHIIDYRERVRIDGKLLAEQAYCEAFAAVESVRSDTLLTYFEYGTLAGLYMLARAKLDVCLLEVGLGGRLDAVNIIDADISVITSVDLDHQDWLGDTREKIGYEKAGILRAEGKAIIGDPEPPASVLEHINQLGCEHWLQGHDFQFALVASSDNNLEGTHWHWRTHREKGSDELLLNDLPKPNLPIQNASTALAVLHLMCLLPAAETIQEVLSSVSLPGRFHSLQQTPDVIVDVAHNPQACRYLAQQIRQQAYDSLYFVCGMLADKDMSQSLAPLLTLDASWHISPLNTPRSAALVDLQSALVGQQPALIVSEHASVADALAQALSKAKENDLVIAFGSFYTVAEAIKALAATSCSEGS